MDNFSFLGNGDIGNFDNLFEQYHQDPESVDESWRRFFEGFEFSKANYDQENINASIPEAFQKEVNVLNLIGAYRQRGHLFAGLAWDQQLCEKLLIFLKKRIVGQLVPSISLFAPHT